jgi:hypothetical protein
MRYTIYYADGTGGYAPTSQPVSSTYEFAIIDEAPDGGVINAGVGTVKWAFTALSAAEYDAIKARRGSRGEVQILTLNDSRQWVTLNARIDPNPGAPNFFRGMVPSLTIEFRRAEVA